MRKYENPERNTWSEILKRPLLDVSDLYGRVQAILNEIRKNGDSALKKYTLQFDGVLLESLSVSEKEMEEAILSVSDELKEAIAMAKKNIDSFHA